MFSYEPLHFGRAPLRPMFRSDTLRVTRRRVGLEALPRVFGRHGTRYSTMSPPLVRLGGEIRILQGGDWNCAGSFLVR